MLAVTRMHSKLGRGIAVSIWLVLGYVVADTIVRGDSATLLKSSGAFAFVGLLSWAVAWSPYVECSPAGVHLRNVLRDITVPWPSLQAVDGRYGLTLDTAYGRFSAWSASRPRMTTTGPNEILAVHPASVIDNSWASMRATGHLDGAAIEPDFRPVRWRRDVVTGVVMVGSWILLTQWVGAK